MWHEQGLNQYAQSKFRNTMILEDQQFSFRAFESAYLIPAQALRIHILVFYKKTEKKRWCAMSTQTAYIDTNFEISLSYSMLNILTHSPIHHGTAVIEQRWMKVGRSATLWCHYYCRDHLLTMITPYGSWITKSPHSTMFVTQIYRHDNNYKLNYNCFRVFLWIIQWSPFDTLSLLRLIWYFTVCDLDLRSAIYDLGVGHVVAYWKLT